MLAEIRESIDLIARFIEGLSEDTFEADALRRDATAFRILVIGESASRLSDPLKARMQDIDWRGMISLRHRLAHDYWSTNFSVLWAIASREVPLLAEAIDRL